jgi:hypothetical protein
MLIFLVFVYWKFTFSQYILQRSLLKATVVDVISMMNSLVVDVIFMMNNLYSIVLKNMAEWIFLDNLL